MDGLPHPITPGGARPLAWLEHRACTDPGWHFRVALPRGAAIAQGAPEAPSHGAPQEIGRFRVPEPSAAVRVLGVRLAYEIDAGDWLLGLLDAQEKEVVSSRPVETPAGWTGDVVARWSAAGEARAGRFIARKWGNRMFVVSCESSAAAYAGAAEELLRILASVRPVAPPVRLFAEPSRLVLQRAPALWQCALPESWHFLPEPPGEGVAAFQAAQIPLDADRTFTHLHGRLSFAVADVSLARSPRDAASAYLEAARDAGFAPEHEEFAERPLRAISRRGRPLDGAWRLVTPTKREGVPAELRCDVLLLEGAWVVAGVVGPIREAQPLAWMRNKRVLDVVTTTFAMAPEEAGR